jgi:hypothetical protein
LEEIEMPFMLDVIQRKPSFLVMALVTGIFVAGCLPAQAQVDPSLSSGVPAFTSAPQVSPDPTQTPHKSDGIPTQTLSTVTPLPAKPTQPLVLGHSRGYLTTPQELETIKIKADQGIEPYHSSVLGVLEWADKQWDFKLQEHEKCKNSDRPAWDDNQKGTPILYAKALAYHLTGDTKYAEEVKDILERIMTEVKTISIDDPQCRLNFGWGTPELVASADLIEDYWQNQMCTGPTGTLYVDGTIGSGDCKILFQNWLAKNPYYVVSLSAVSNNSNWGAAATNATAYIADYLWDRPDISLVHRYPEQLNNGGENKRTPAEAFAYANQLALDRMNGYTVEYISNYSCDYLGGQQQSKEWSPVKSQITENGIIPEDARREEYCNIPRYNGEYQNYPQLHIGNNIQQCELMLRRGDPSCYDNVDSTDIPNYKFIDPGGQIKTTHLYPGRGSLERAINAIIVDSNTVWKRDAALSVAYRYYYWYHTTPGFDQWHDQIDSLVECDQDVCFGILTHAFAPGEVPGLPPTVSPP